MPSMERAFAECMPSQQRQRTEGNWKHWNLPTRLHPFVMQRLAAEKKMMLLPLHWHQYPPCSSVPVQRSTVCWSVSGQHAFCQRGPTGSSEDENCNLWSVVLCHWTTSLEQSVCYCLRHWLIFVLQETAESVSIHLTAVALVALNWRL